ncbi:hypothetical protein KCH_38070 [Kitasatospora cheerisanensis KCTC 2395]|uniref:Uncharacterized protein n=1 Tax=Kitasatospora cheerisanensis KCTC 2395 TaxID=1348663 RepID=A0A066Z0Z5_9ACTN|nr:hypothetical protein KCH_38070 [Kitasatospora cheerisanensis KCTC 2395]
MAGVAPGGGAASAWLQAGRGKLGARPAGGSRPGRRGELCRCPNRSRRSRPSLGRPRPGRPSPRPSSASRSSPGPRR